jgi:hypothetical protein
MSTEKRQLETADSCRELLVQFCESPKRKSPRRRKIWEKGAKLLGGSLVNKGIKAFWIEERFSQAPVAMERAKAFFPQLLGRLKREDAAQRECGHKTCGATAPLQFLFPNSAGSCR